MYFHGKTECDKQEKSIKLHTKKKQGNLMKTLHPCILQLSGKYKGNLTDAHSRQQTRSRRMESSQTSSFVLLTRNSSALGAGATVILHVFGSSSGW